MDPVLALLGRLEATIQSLTQQLHELAQERDELKGELDTKKSAK